MRRANAHHRADLPDDRSAGLRRQEDRFEPLADTIANRAVALQRPDGAFPDYIARRGLGTATNTARR